MSRIDNLRDIFFGEKKVIATYSCRMYSQIIYHFIIFIFLCFGTIFYSHAQVEEGANNPWIIGFYINVINDSGAFFQEPFNIKQNYNYAYPIKSSIEKRFQDDFGIQLSGSYNKLTNGKKINGEFIMEDTFLASVNTAFVYYFSNIFLDKYRSYYEIYSSTGLGRSFQKNRAYTTFNVEFGINYFISESFRIVISSTAKLSFLNSKEKSNYMQFNVGGIIRL